MRTYWLVRLYDWATNRYRWSKYHIGDSVSASTFHLKLALANPRTDSELFGFDYSNKAWKPSREIGYSSYYMGTPEVPVTPSLRQALSRVFQTPSLSIDRPAATLGELEILGAISKPKSYYRLHLVNQFAEPMKEKWTPYYKMTESKARFWQGNATRAGGKWLALLEKFVNEEGWIEI